MAQKAQIDLLIELYREAQLRLIRIITSGAGAGTKTYYNTVLKQLEQLMKQLQTETGRYIDTAIPEEYKKALDETYEYFQRNNLTMKRPDMLARIHADAVHELSREMQYHITQGISIAGRRVMRYLDESRDNILRQQGLRASAVKIASGQTVKDMQKDLMQRLANEGFLTVQYGSGKGAYQVGLDTYAAMVARSTTREAGNLARENQLVDNGYDLMEMTEHYPTCGACAQLQGRVYSISGKDKRFPPLSRAFQSGYRNVHPNCRHVMTYFVESMQTPEEMEAAIRKSNKPFEDNRSADEKALYSQQQADSRRMRADRSQFERYRARLGDDAPKTFSQFRKLKKQGGEKWEEMQKLYRSKFPKTVDNSGRSGIINNRGSGTGSATESHYYERIGNIDATDRTVLAKTLRDFENTYANSNTEHCIVIAADGEVFVVHGDRYTVDTSLLGNRLIGSVNEHNHVTGESQYSFSWEDLASSVSDGSKIVVAFDEKYRYSITMPIKTVDADFDDIKQKAKDIVFNKIIFGNADITSENLQHEMVNEACKMLGIKYERVRR